jgi:molybdopterin synthase sulfur carrier subunit
MIRVVIPQHLRILARINGELQLDVAQPVTIKTVLDTIETQYPMLCGTLRDQSTGQRRAMVRFYACEQDFSNDSLETPLPEAIAEGQEPLLIIGAISGG